MSLLTTAITTESIQRPCLNTYYVALYTLAYTDQVLNPFFPLIRNGTQLGCSTEQYHCGANPDNFRSGNFSHVSRAFRRSSNETELLDLFLQLVI